MKTTVRILGLLIFLFGLFMNYLDWYLLHTTGLIADTYFYFVCKAMLLIQMPYPHIAALFLWAAPTLFGLLVMVFPMDISFREIIDANQKQNNNLERR